MLPHNIIAKNETQQNLINNFTQIQQQIVTTALKNNRNPKDIKLLPVTKTINTNDIIFATKLGYTNFGENKVQEAYQKWQTLSKIPKLKWTIIGPLQSNKTKYVAKFAHEFQALDNLKIAQHLDKHLKQENRTLKTLVQINTSNEPQKSGIHPKEAKTFLNQIAQYENLQITGLMTIAVASLDKEKIRNCFKILRNLKNELQQETPNNICLKELSMGMSSDYKIAIEEGSTLVRIGQDLFGQRK